MTGKLQKETNQAKLSSLFPHAHIESQENHPSDCGHHAFERRCTSSFPSSKLFTQTRWHKRAHPSFHSRLTCGDVCTCSWQNTSQKGVRVPSSCEGRAWDGNSTGALERLDNLFARFRVLLGLLLFAFAFVLLLKGQQEVPAGGEELASPLQAATSSADPASFLLQGRYHLLTVIGTTNIQEVPPVLHSKMVIVVRGTQ